MDHRDGSGPSDQLAPYQGPPDRAPAYADRLSRLARCWKQVWQGSAEPCNCTYPHNGFGNPTEEANRVIEGKGRHSLWCDPSSTPEGVWSSGGGRALLRCIDLRKLWRLGRRREPIGQQFFAHDDEHESSERSGPTRTLRCLPRR